MQVNVGPTLDCARGNLGRLTELVAAMRGAEPGVVMYLIQEAKVTTYR